MIEVDSKCPRCGEGVMKLPPNPTPLWPIVPPDGLVRCTKCGFEDQALRRGKE